MQSEKRVTRLDRPFEPLEQQQPTTLRGISLTRLAWYRGVYRWQWGPLKEPDWLLRRRLLRAVMRSRSLPQ